MNVHKLLKFELIAALRNFNPLSCSILFCMEEISFNSIY